SRPRRFLNRRSSSATSSRQSIPSTEKVDSVWSSHTEQGTDLGVIGRPLHFLRRVGPHPHALALGRSKTRRPRAGRGRSRKWTPHEARRPCRSSASLFALLHVLEPLLEQTDDVLIVERIEDHSSSTARAHQAHAAEQAKLMR